MPILEVEIVTRPGEELSPSLATVLANRAGEIFSAPPGTTWVKVSAIPSELYAENNISTAETPTPVFVTVLKARLSSEDALQNEIQLLTNAIALICDRPADCIHIIYQPQGSGRVAFGGRLIP